MCENKSMRGRFQLFDMSHMPQGKIIAEDNAAADDMICLIPPEASEKSDGMLNARLQITDQDIAQTVKEKNTTRPVRIPAFLTKAACKTSESRLIKRTTPVGS